MTLYDSSRLTPELIEAELGLAPLPIEGGKFVATWRDEYSSAIYFLITPSDFSGLHRLEQAEGWFFHAGAPASMLLLTSDGRVEEPVLGLDLKAGQRPQVVVPAGVYMAAEPLGAWSFLSTYVSPPWSEASVTFPEAEEIIGMFPSTAADRIRRVARHQV